MQVSGLILLIFVNYALQQSTHDIQKFICTADVEIDEDRNTLVLRNTGASCQYVPLVVDRNGFKFDIVFPSDVAHEELEFLDLLFENSTARVSLYFKKPYDETEIYGGGRILTTSYSSTATIKVSAGGTGYIYHGNAADIILFPSLTDLPTVATDKAVLKMKFIWRNLINGLNVRFVTSGDRLLVCYNDDYHDRRPYTRRFGAGYIPRLYCHVNRRPYQWSRSQHRSYPRNR
uniref:IgGFc_binding domain-containing protein n=1 Tax=Panagrellus redivivus TaxID=6233 RepID=A0A7E4VWK3_PANRE